MRQLTTAALVLSSAVASAGFGPAPSPRTQSPDSSTVWRDQIVYVLIPHKFQDGDPSNNRMRDRYDLPNPNYEGGFLGGDIAGIRQRMAYLKSLGVSSVLLYPILSNDENPFFKYLATGYSVKNYQAIDANFGTDAELDAALREFHSTSNGPRLNVILDLPIAMTGREHPWLAMGEAYPWYYRPWNVVASENIGSSPMRMPYGDVDNDFGTGIVNHLLGIESQTAVYAALRDEIVFGLTDRFDIDGFRYDSAQNAYAIFWKRLMEDFRARYEAAKPEFMHVAEVFVARRRSWQVYPYEFMNEAVFNDVGPIRMDGAYDFGLIDAIQDVFARGAAVQKIVTQVNVAQAFYEHPDRLIASVDSYENPTFLMSVDGTHARQKLLLATAFLLTIHRVPFLYSGNEYGIDYHQPGELFAEGLDERYRSAFGRLVAIRRDVPAFRRGSFRWLDLTGTILSYERAYEDEEYVVVLNNDDAPASITIALGPRGIDCAGVANLLKPNDPNLRLNGAGTKDSSLSARLAAWEPKIVACRRSARPDAAAPRGPGR